MIATRLYPIEGDLSIPQVGSRLAAFTGIAGIGFLDTMVVTEYDPPWRWVMQHEGAFVRVSGSSRSPRRPTGCRFTWAEELDLPFGLIGRLGWPLVKPIAHLGLLGLLRRMARQLERGSLPPAMAPDAAASTAIRATTRVGAGTGARAGRGDARGGCAMTPGEPAMAAPAPPADRRPSRPVAEPTIESGAGGAPARRNTSNTTTWSGAARCTGTTRCTSGCAWRRSSPA